MLADVRAAVEDWKPMQARMAEVMSRLEGAREADVSTATVSRVLNGTSGVSADRAGRVRDAAARLGYVPCGSARALRRQQATVWAAIVPDIANPFFTALVRGIEDVARVRNHRLVLCNSDEDLEREASYLDIVIAERMAGVVIAVASNRDSSLAPLIERGVPTVAVDRRPSGSRLDSVVVDNRSGAAEAVTHLLAMGCRRVGCITGPRRVSTSTERLEGYRDALVAHGLPVDRALVRRADFKEDGGYRATRSLFESSTPPDALFIHGMALVLQVPRHLPHAVERGVQELLVDQQHEVEVHAVSPCGAW